MKDNEMRLAAKAFAEYWKDRGYEKGDGATHHHSAQTIF